MTGPCESSVKLDANYGDQKLARDCNTCLVLKEHLCPRLGVMTDRRRVYRLRVVLENMWEVQYVSPIITVASKVASTIWVKIGVVLRMIEITSQYLRNCKCGNQQTSESSRTRTCNIREITILYCTCLSAIAPFTAGRCGRMWPHAAEFNIAATCGHTHADCFSHGE
jgi:hypothetical protein